MFTSNSPRPAALWRAALVAHCNRPRRTAGRLALTLPFLLVGCKSTSFSLEAPDAAASPQAKAEPAPLASAPPLASAAAVLTGPGSDTHAVPAPLRLDQELPADVPREALRETDRKELAHETKEVTAYVLQAVLRSGEGPGPPRAPEVNAAAIDSARRKTEARMTIEASQTRARFVFVSGFVLPPSTELRARADHFGHLLLWPGERTYRIVQPGALRSLIGERRMDVAPLAAVEIRQAGEGRRLNLPTRHIEVSTRAGKAALDLATLRDSVDGGPLVCRLLLDLMSASPTATPCGADEVPLHAEIHWATRGALTFEVTGIARQVDIPVQDLATPPGGYNYVETPPDSQPSELLLPRNEIAAFRSVPVDVPLPLGREGHAAPDAGLVLINSSDELRIAWIDGVPVAWVGPGERLLLGAMLRGHYALQWRTFLGDSWEAPDSVVVPGASEVGGTK